MRRKSERAASKKAKASPEKKVEKVKRTRSRRKKSTSSENESAEETSPVREAESVPIPEVVPPKTPVKEDNQEEAQDQVWRVKAAEGSGDGGEIQKLKICLTRPPTTPERVDRSPRSKRKHSRATSSSDGTPSGEAPEEKRKGKHRSKRALRESKDESEKTQDSQDDDVEAEVKTNQEPEKQPSVEPTQSEAEGKVDSSENTITTSNVESKESEKTNVDSSEDSTSKGDTEKTTGNDDKSGKDDKTSDADTTVDSPKDETTVVSATPEIKSPAKTETKESEAEDKIVEPESPTRRRSASVDKSEILELHPEETKVESDIETDKSKLNSSNVAEQKDKVSKSDRTLREESKSDNNRSSNKTGVVANSENEKRSRNSTESVKSQSDEKSHDKSCDGENHKSFDRSDSIQSNQEEPLHNGQTVPIVISRKRRWGSRPSKVTKQKSITISSDILKDIIPDVKPVEFEEVIEEKKHKRVVTERVERPVLPKIVIDNSENAQRAEKDRHVERKDEEEKEKDIVKPRDMATNRKISIIKDNDSIIARPPSPPRHKQSHVLYITNLVRPFTLPQLKNLLQRTGRIVDNGFWIDRIKSKCFVIYETEDQAVETRHALHGVTWPVSNPKTLQVDFSTQEAFDKAKMNEDTENAQASTIPGTVEDWLREQDMKRERGEVEKPWEKKLATREWDLGKNDKEKEKERVRRDERPPLDKRRHRSSERSPEPARKFKKKEEEAPAKLLDDLFKKTKATPCIYWLPLSAETIAIKEEQRRQHMAEHERRMQEQRRTHRRH